MSLFPHGRWLLCPPTYFDVTYEINPWMDIDQSPVKPVAGEQWRSLHHTLIRLGAFVEYVEPKKESPDIVFTANAGLVKGNDFVLSRFAVKERQAEEPVFRAWFESRGFKIHTVSTGSFEGEGDALFAGEKLFCGYGFRTEQKVYGEVQKLLNIKELVFCELVDPRFYHVDTCFCPLNESTALFFPAAFTPESIKTMEKHLELLPVTEADAEKFVCNAVVLGQDVVLPAGCDSTYALLKSRGFNSYPVQLGEFLKGGGSAKCLSLRLDR